MGLKIFLTLPNKANIFIFKSYISVYLHAVVTDLTKGNCTNIDIFI